MSIEGYCECGRKSTGKFSYRRNEQYCSKYCHDFMEIKVDGEKTAYDLWYGTGKYALNPPYPKLTMNCAWCEGECSLPRGLHDANKWFCSAKCSKQANRNPKSTSSRTGSTQISNQIRMVMVLREKRGEFLDAKTIAQYYEDWFRRGCTANKVSSTMRLLTAKGHVIKKEGHKTNLYQAGNLHTTLKAMFGETELKLGRGIKNE